MAAAYEASVQATRLTDMKRVADGTVETPVVREPLLVISSDGRWFQLPAGPKITLMRRRSLRLVLRRLLEERLARPGSALSVDELLAAGWPGERVVPHAGAARVYVAISTLRKMGLRDFLVSRDDGYLLDPDSKTKTEAGRGPRAPTDPVAR
jgi:hypothetical protein